MVERQEQQDHGGGKEGRDLEEGSVGRDEGRGNPEEPDLSVTSNGREQLRGRGGGASGRKE